MTIDIALWLMGILVLAVLLAGRFRRDPVRWHPLGVPGHLLNRDPLTGLLNRAGLTEQLSPLMAGRAPLACLLLGLDDFKSVNGAQGHRQGDLMLAEVARRLSQALPQAEALARICGDEFAVVVPGVERPDAAERLAESLREVLEGDYLVGQARLWSSASVGIALYPGQVATPEELVGNAHQALLAAKTEGRNRICLYDQAMHEEASHRFRLSNDLHRALDAGQLEVHFQPIVDLRTGRPVKAEALLRWTHDTLGPVSPALFVPIAEDGGMIQEIGDWVFRESARVAMVWNRLSSAHPESPLRISVNCSPRQFMSRDFSGQALAFLEAQGIPGTQLGIEITERLLLEDRPEVTRQLAALREAGLTLSLDDFGTGYSSLSYLRRFALDDLKIDRCFIQDLTSNENSQAIVEAIIAMAHRLGLRTVAEGVEDFHQAAFLRKAGCGLAQGFLHGHPMPEAQFLAWVCAMEEREPESPALAMLSPVPG